METPKKRILLVDDEEHLRVTLGDYLAFEGYDVATARDGEDALLEIGKTPPDLILLDIRMPRMGGIHFLRTISGQDGKPRYPVLVVTAVSAMEEFFGTVDVDGFISKPYDAAKLLSRIRQILAKSAAGAERPKRPARRVLVAENDSGVAGVLKRLFAEAGYQIEVASSGPEAVEKAVVCKPDVLVLKEIMPGMNGSAVAQIVKAMPGTSGIPVVIYDGTRTPDVERKFPNRVPDGVSAFLLTSDPADLFKAVAEVLGS